MKKKLVPILLVVVIVFNFILCTSVYADPDTSKTDFSKYGGDATVDSGTVKELIDNGKDSNGNVMKHSNFGMSVIGVLLQYLSSTLNGLPYTLQGAMTLITQNPKSDGDEDGFLDKAADFAAAAFSLENRFTINRTVFNEISIFNCNVFNRTSSYTLGVDGADTIYQSEAVIKLKENTAGWFFICRTLAIMMNVIVLVYVGIRMTLSTVASEQARYKKMLMDWAMSFIIIFLLPYIMMMITGISEIFENIMYSIRKSFIDNGEISFEDTIMEKLYWILSNKGGNEFFMYSLFFWFLTYLQGKYFFAYFKRMLSVFFLTIISPFITITYPIDKMGDGKAQAFDAWFKEYVINVIIQPIHAAIYIIFVFTAGKIAEKAPYVAMIFLLSLGKVENIVRNAFGLTGSVVMHTVDWKKRKK